MAETVLRNVISFMDNIGIYDVVLPFLLIFTIVFAIFERSKILGTEKIGKETYTKKNLNAMAAFVISFLVVASSKLVETITAVSSQVVILILLSVFFLLLVGMFYKEGEIGEKGLEGPWRTVFIFVNFLGLVLIFLNAIKSKSGITWLQELVNWLNKFWTSAAVGSVILIILLILFIGWIVGPDKKKEKKEEK